MSTTTHDELEAALRELFERQVEALGVNTRDWDDLPMATVSPAAAPHRSRSAMAAILATAAAVALVVGAVAIIPARSGVYVGGQPGAPAPVHFATRQVSLSADSLSIDAGGHHFTAGGSTVDVNSDPGTHDKYTTLELVWIERGVEMRLNIYFTSDGHDWWANEIRTYNGKSPGDWLEYTGTYFRSPLNTAFAGNVDLGATDSGRVHFSNLRLQPFLPPAVCKDATTKYVLDPAYERVVLVSGADGFGLGTTALLETASCTAVTDPHAFSFDWRVGDPAVVRLETYDGNTNVLHTALLGTDPTTSADLYRKGAGSTTLHVTARERSTGKVVATTDIPVTVERSTGKVDATGEVPVTVG
jgi:hypothetical protein